MILNRVESAHSQLVLCARYLAGDGECGRAPAGWNWASGINCDGNPQQ